jgi:hypothetical protein
MFARVFLVACLFGVTGCGDDSKNKGGGNKSGFDAKPLDNPPPPGGGSTPPPAGGKSGGGAPGGTPGVG